MKGVLKAFVRGLVRWPVWAAGDLARVPRVHEMPQHIASYPDRARGAPLDEDALRLVSMNIAYGRGPCDDAGDLRSREDILEYLEAIAAHIESSGAEVALLQEVDFASARTHFIHQGHALAQRLGWPFYAEIPIWRAAYVPYPLTHLRQHYKRLHMGQVVLSRYPIVRNTRLALPAPNAWTRIYKAFYLNRAAQAVRVRRQHTDIDLLNVHLEAFDTPNREHQAALLARWVRTHTGPHRVLAGDLNTLPPRAALRSGFWDEPEIDFSRDRTLQLIHNTLPHMVDVLGDTDDPDTWTFPADRPSRRLDFVYASTTAWNVQSARVLGAPSEAASDHRPIYTALTPRM